MIHLYRVYFDSVADATEVYADSHADAAVDIAIRLGRNAGDAVVRYVKTNNSSEDIIMPTVVNAISNVATKTPHPPQPMIECKGDDLIVIASSPEELVSSQHATIAKVSDKIAATKAELEDAREIKSAADMAKIDATAAIKLIKKSEARLMYLEKVKGALEAGYVLVPNFPGDVVVIRVKRNLPRQNDVTVQSDYASADREKADLMPAEEGRYVDPVPVATLQRNLDAQNKVASRHLLIEGFSEDEVSLPAEFMRPTIIKKFGEAMNLRLFDELVLVTGNNEGPTGGHVNRIDVDPLVIGRIIEKYGTYGRRKHISFLVAWFFDTSDI